MSEVRKAAELLLNELGISEPSEIDLEAIAAYCGAYVVYEALAGSEARIVGSGDKAFITINSDSRRSRQRFSIGHELGHWMWDRGKMAFSCSKEVQDTFWSGADKETLANRYASDLLLPALMFQARAQRRDATLDTVSDLANVFQASLTATALRLVEFGTFPCMFVVHTSSGLAWYRGTKEVDGRFWPRKQLDEYSFAYDLLRGKTPGRASGEVDADTWINHPRADRYELIESSMLTSQHKVLTLLWWKNEQMIEELLGDKY
jgi:Zn-dependent peptidase ImmA (M78 family)